MKNIKNTPTKKPNNNSNINNNSNNIKIMALGGLGEVGKNCYVIEYKNDLFVIDYGVLFPDKDLLGIDYIIPNYNYLLENKHKIKGLFITHGHEDHIGGIPWLLKVMEIKNIYAPKTALLMIEKKLREHKLSTNLIEINDNTELKFGCVNIITYRQTHSIPDAIGFFIETPAGNIVTTGDFKVDFSPPGQEAADFHKMVELSKKGVLCLLSDSTNAMTPGFSISESYIGKNLKILISEAKGRIMFTTFASNINRVQQIVEGALDNNRKICIMGRSMTNALAIGRATKYLNVKPKDIIEPKQINNYNPNEVVIICTGSQGEVLAALSRIANGMHQHIELDENDHVVFASSPIPGNNYQIGKVIDALSKTNCTITRNEDYFKTHASGHASQEEQKLLISLWKPKYFLPIHGTYNMLVAHKRTAIDLGIKEENIFLIDNGDILFMNNNKPFIKRKSFPGESMYVSGNNINVAVNNGVMEQLAGSGIFLMTAVYDKKKNLVSYPQTVSRGFIIINESIDLLKEIQKQFIEKFHKHKKNSIDKITANMEKDLIEFINKKTNKLPLVKVVLIEYTNKSEEEIFKEIKEKNRDI